MEAMTCAALAGIAPAGWRGKDAYEMPMVADSEKPWCKEAREAKLGSKQEAERLHGAPNGRSERLTGVILPRLANETEAVREVSGWAKVVKVRGDDLVNWWRNMYRTYRGRGVGFRRVSEVAEGLVDRVPMPVQRPPVTEDRMVQRHSAPEVISREVEELSGWEGLLTVGAGRRLGKFKEANDAD